MAAPNKSSSRWGSFLSQAVAGVESRLDNILADVEETQAQQQAQQQQPQKQKQQQPQQAASGGANAASTGGGLKPSPGKFCVPLESKFRRD
jgi:TolA-binding protein